MHDLEVGYPANPVEVLNLVVPIVTFLARFPSNRSSFRFSLIKTGNIDRLI
jgi:hypothetical protein